MVSLATAKARLRELICQAEKGEEIPIARHGQPAVRLSPVEPRKLAVASRAMFRAGLPARLEDGASPVGAARDEER